jgi:hypothetical protein
MKKAPATAIVDSQSVKTTELAGSKRGYDATKKIRRCKRHRAVDTLQLVLAVGVHPAALHDYETAGLVAALDQQSQASKVILADSAYDRNGLAEWVRSTFG